MPRLMLVMLTAIAVAFANIVVAAVPASASAETTIRAYVRGDKQYWKSQSHFVYASVTSGSPSVQVKSGTVEFSFEGKKVISEIDSLWGEAKLPLSEIDAVGKTTVTARYLGSDGYARSDTSLEFEISPDPIDVGPRPFIYEPRTNSSELEVTGRYSKLPVPDGRLVAMGYIYEAGAGKVKNGKVTLRWTEDQHPKSDKYDGTGTWGGWSYRTGAMRDTTFDDASSFLNAPFKIAGTPVVTLALDSATVSKSSVYGQSIKINASVRDQYSPLEGFTAYFQSGDFRTSGVSQANGVVNFENADFTPATTVKSARVWIEDKSGETLNQSTVSLNVAPVEVRATTNSSVLNDGRTLQIAYDGYPQGAPVEGSAKVLLDGAHVATVPLERVATEEGSVVQAAIDLSPVSGQTGQLSIELIDSVNVTSPLHLVALAQASHDITLSILGEGGKTTTSVVGGKSATLRAQVTSDEARIDGYSIQFKQGDSVLGTPVPIDPGTGSASRAHSFTSASNNGKNVAFSAELIAPSGVIVQSSDTVRVAQVTPPPILTTLKVSIDGTRRVGRTLTAVATGNIKPTSFKYQWYVDGVAIKGATSKTYKIHSSRVGKRLSVKVTATRSGASVAKVSGRTSVIARAVTTLKLSSSKTVSLKKTATVKVTVSATGITSSRGTVRVKVGKTSVSKVITKPGTLTFKIKGSSIGTGTKTLTATFTPSAASKTYISTPSKKTAKIKVVR